MASPFFPRPLYLLLFPWRPVDDDYYPSIRLHSRDVTSLLKFKPGCFISDICNLRFRIKNNRQFVQYQYYNPYVTFRLQNRTRSWAIGSLPWTLRLWLSPTRSTLATSSNSRTRSPEPLTSTAARSTPSTSRRPTMPPPSSTNGWVPNKSVFWPWRLTWLLPERLVLHRMLHRSGLY